MTTKFLLILSDKNDFTDNVVNAFIQLGWTDAEMVVGSLKNIIDCDVPHPPSRILIDVTEMPTEGSISAIKNVLSKFKSAKSVIAGLPQSSELVIRLVKMGIHDFIAYPLHPAELVQVLNQVPAVDGARDGTMPKKNTMITILGPKGGSGATLLTANLGLALAKKHPGETLICDLPCQCGDLATYLDMSPIHTIRHWIDRYGQVDESYVDGLILKHSLGLHVLSGPKSDQEPLSSKHLKELQSILWALKERYRYVVIDSGAVDPGLAQACLMQSDYILLVGCLDIPSLKGLTTVYQKLIRLEFRPNQIKIILNRANAKNQLSVNAFEKNINHPIACSLPNNYALCNESINTGKSLFELDANADISKKIAELATIIEIPKSEKNHSPVIADSLADKMARFLMRRTRA